MVGTIVNVGTIIVGSTIGAFLKKGIKEKYKKTVTQALGLVGVSLGMTWIVKNISASEEPILFIVSMVLGALIGEWIDLDAKLNNLLSKLSKSDPNDENQMIQGLVTAILLFCVGTLSILGPLESALKGDNTLLFTNAMLDGVTSLILASTFGIGIILSAGVLFIWQGTIYLSAGIIAPFMTDALFCQISIIGGILIFATGLNILEIIKVKTINLLPALAIPILYFLIFK